MSYRQSRFGPIKGGYSRTYNPYMRRWIRSGVRGGTAARGRALTRRRGYSTVPRTRGWAASGEMKYFDTERQVVALVATTTTWPAGTIKDPSSTINLGDAAVATPACLFAPIKSASLNGRIGRKIKIFKIKIRGLIDVPAQASVSAGDAGTRVRIVLVQDKQTNAGAMTGALLFQDAGQAQTTLSSYQNAANFGRFRICKDKTLNLSNVNLAGSPTSGDVIQSGMSIPWKMNCNFKVPVGVNFNAVNGGTVADIVDNSFHIIAAVDSIALAPRISYYCRVSFSE